MSSQWGRREEGESSGGEIVELTPRRVLLRERSPVKRIVRVSKVHESV